MRSLIFQIEDLAHTMRFRTQKNVDVVWLEYVVVISRQKDTYSIDNIGKTYFLVAKH